MKPSVGRIVHYFRGNQGNPTGDGQLLPSAAIITYVFSDELVNLTVFSDTGVTVQRQTSVRFSAENEQGCWNWPARVEG